MQFNTNNYAIFRTSVEDQWIPHFPNPADFRFNYFKMLNNAPSGIGKVNKNIAIVGAGCAGMTVARELMRCGCNVTIFEASDRIGGRLFTQDNPNGADQTGMEMGAMRMPFFNDQSDDSHESVENADNSILGYYLFREPQASNKAKFDTFPNPGNAPGNTGIYMNQGLGPDLNNLFPKPELISWPQNEDANNETIKQLNDQVGDYITYFTNIISEVYVESGEAWPTLWAKIVNHYSSMTFDDVVMAKAVYVTDTSSTEYAEAKKYSLETGDFGGMGMNADQASILYTVGTGDGSWGAFYSIAALWWIRCTMFGFGGQGLQTIIGYSDPASLPHYNVSGLKDSAGNPIPAPTYSGIQSLVEYLYFETVETQSGSATSVYESGELYLNTSVSVIRRKADSSFEVTTNKGDTFDFDYVFVTSPQWATQMSLRFEGLDATLLPLQKIMAEHTQHNISSCKLFFPLKEHYWEKEDNKIPQILVTDTFIQDAYAFSWGSQETDKGVILASYTWEDDSLKLLPFDKQSLSEKVINELENITVSTTGQNVTEYIDSDKPVMLQWIKQPSYIGCAKLYRQRDEHLNLLDLSYNQNFSGKSGLYFAGENYSVEGGWTEPALRSALDAVVQFINHVNGEFSVSDFSYDQNYPRWPNTFV